ncbi:hypothetical protein PAPYR_10983 [Paratrimastix pyriformis]|uniref:Secreted protein n=1 Tax=Paratrimastix pyriformis TaxID=342808 RepID=A0ABQ8U4R7_9EUKA|nr:hypothetical protein PAPYR_10983 [Paratrimastix pyriformis]
MLDLLLFLFGRLVFLAGALGLLLLSFIFGDSVQASGEAGAAAAADDLGVIPRVTRSRVTAAAARLTKFLSAFLGHFGGIKCGYYPRNRIFEVVFRHHPKCFSMKLIDLHHQNRYRDVCRY